MLDISINKYIYIDGERTNYLVSIYGEVFNAITGMKLKTYTNPIGYIGLVIYHNKKQVYCNVHRLVAQAFIPNPENKASVNHIDGDKSNNYYGNLEWATYSENNSHAYETNLHPKGENFYNAKVTDAIVHNICKDIESGVKLLDISERYSVSYDIVKNIRRQTCWKHISKLYNFPEIIKKDTSVEMVKLICEHLQNPSLTYKEISRILNIDESVVAGIGCGHTWKTISSDYNIRPRRVIKFTGFDNDTINKISEYLKQGIKAKRICELINIPYNKMHKGAIERIKKKQNV